MLGRAGSRVPNFPTWWYTSPMLHLPPKIHPLVDLQRFLSHQSLHVGQGHLGRVVAQLILDGLGVAGVPEPLQAPLWRRTWTAPV